MPLEREADADVILRTLYEHVTTFAWLAAEPNEERMQLWLKADSKQRLKADDDCAKVGYPMLEPGLRGELEHNVATIQGSAPNLPDRAAAADAYWSGKIMGLHGSETPTSLRGLYAFAYRRLSAIAHPSNMGLNAVAVPLDGGPATRVQLEQIRPELKGPFGLGSVVYAIGLYVAGQSLGWPAPSAVDGVLETH